MTKQESIEAKQNEESQLKCQLAASYYFNKAEFLILPSFLMTIIPAFSSYLSLSNLPVLQIYLPLINVLLNIIGLMLYSSLTNNVRIGASLRQYFDDQVLDFNPNDYLPCQELERKQKILFALQKIAKQAKRNGSTDIDFSTVKNWYVFYDKYPDDKVVHECQRQNQYFTKSQLIFRWLLNISVATLVVLIYWFLLQNGLSLLNCLISLSGFTLSMASRIKSLFKYTYKFIQVKAIHDVIEFTYDEKQIAYEQSLWNELRLLPVLGIDIIHKKTHKQLSKKDEQAHKL